MFVCVVSACIALVILVKVVQLCPTLCDPMDYTGILRPEYWSGQLFPSPGDLPNPEIKPRSPILQADSLPAEPQGKPKNTGMSTLSLLQRIFPTQEFNQGFLHCRRILYQLSYQGSPHTGRGILQARILEWVAIPFSRGSSQPRDQTRVSGLKS